MSAAARCPTSTLPVYGVTDGNGSRTTVAELGDVNGDGKNDYAVGMPYADANGADSGIVYVFLGPGVPAPASLNVATASFRIVGHAGELLGFSLGGGDVNGDGYADIAIGAPMAGPPARVGGGAVYVIFGSAHPVDVDTTVLSGTAHTNGTNPAPHSPIGSRYDGFLQDGHMGMSLAVLPDVNGDGYADVADRGARMPTCIAPAAAPWQCSTASPPASTSRSPICGAPATPTSSTSTFPIRTTSTSARASRPSPT